jgi:glyoxylase-like metal-dependent hydrolase (beta-lactamase superfamily II)
MQEIAEGVYIENSFAGVVLGAVSMGSGLLMIDAPIFAEDARLWRSSMMNFSSVGNRLLVSMDAHHDRSLGLRNMECRLIGHESLREEYRSRPVSIKAQIQDTGAEWEELNGLGSIRWLVPEITFDDHLWLQWGERPVRLEYHPGPAIGSTWAVVPSAEVIFIADTVVADMPPFLYQADIPQWIESLEVLKSVYKGYTMVSGRSGIVRSRDVDAQIRFLEKADNCLKRALRRKNGVNDLDSVVNRLMNEFPEKTIYQKRLAYGLSQCYQQHYLAVEA